MGMCKSLAVDWHLMKSIFCLTLDLLFGQYMSSQLHSVINYNLLIIMRKKTNIASLAFKNSVSVKPK